MYFEAYTNDQYIWNKNNTEHLYFILGKAELHWNFSSIPKDGSDIHRFSNRELVSSIRDIPKSIGNFPT